MKDLEIQTPDIKPQIMLHFAPVTLLITHYNRSRSLRRLLEAFVELGCSFGGIVVSDDCSKPEHLAALETMRDEFGFTLVTTPKNGGLGHNINKGQDAVQTPYTLYIQEDFVPKPAFIPELQTALVSMDENPVFDIARFYAYIPYPYVIPFRGGFSEMQFRRWGTDYTKIYFYSDHPHLRRSSFLQKFGRYAEGLNVDKTEYRMCVSFIQNDGKGLFFRNFKELLSQENDTAEPSTFARQQWTRSQNPAIAAVRNLYRQLKYNFDIQFMR
jgi:glycosyltransferase involved in cell wall biosynthesis